MANKVNLKWENWNKAPHGVLSLLTSAVTALTIFAPQVLDIIHQAPVEIPTSIDAWVTWCLKMATVILMGFTTFSGKNEDSPKDEREILEPETEKP